MGRRYKGRRKHSHVTTGRVGFGRIFSPVNPSPKQLIMIKCLRL